MSNANYLLEPQTLRLRGSGGLELAADLFGPEDGPLVIFLHGGGQTRHSWKRTGAALAAADCGWSPWTRVATATASGPPTATTAAR
nr:hypothetical protein [Nocardia farcinica]